MKEMLCNNPMFGIALSCGTFWAAGWLQKKCRGNPLVNPLLLSVVAILGILLLFDIPLAYYQQGGELIQLLIAPATALFAVSIYNQRAVLGKNFLPVLVGCCVGSLTNMAVVLLLGRAFSWDTVFAKTMLPKSVTTPIALAISGQIGGIAPITMAAVLVTGIVGVVLVPPLLRLLRIQNEVAQGVAIGTASHVLGTGMAARMGEVQAAMSSVSVGVCGLLTVLLALFW